MSSTDKNRFERIEQMIGPGKLQLLAGARVVVAGLGAVGSYAAEGLARAGVGHFRLVDFDIVRSSNINRQLYALGSTLGRKKCELAAERICDINPEAVAVPLELFVHTDTIDEILGSQPDLVIDAIDSFTPKVELLSEVRSRGIPIVSSLGAALRTDPSMIRVGPLEKVHNDPLGRVVRKKLRQRGIPLDITCVYSIESPEEMRDRAITPADDSEDDYLVRGRRRSTLGSLPTLTGMFGLAAANTAIKMLIDGF